MTAAVGRAAASAAGGTAGAGGGRAAATGAARTTSGTRRPRPRNIDERSQRAAERFDDRWSREGAGDKKPKRAPSSRGYTDAVAAGGEKAPTPAADSSTSTGSTGPTVPDVSMPQPLATGAGFLLAVLAWGWIALPFLKNGPAGVRAVLMAKFLNKAPDGSWLP